MTEQVEPRCTPSDPAPTAPRYSPGARSEEVVAHFASGTTLSIDRGRRRAYPGLASEAPSTLPFYTVASVLETRGRAADLGSGAGMGVRELTPQFGEVVGFDIDPTAVAFAREYDPRGTYLQQDICQPLPGPSFDAVFLCDVLGMVVQPEVALKQARASVSPSGVIVVAEPLAYVSQRLVPPARRAFSKPSMERLLLRAGLAVDAWVCDSGTFGCCLARPNEEARVIVEAQEALELGDTSAAISFLERAARSTYRDVQREALLALAGVRLQLGDGDGAAAGYLAVREAFPEDARSMAGLAQIQFVLGATEDALCLGLEALKRDATEPLGALVAASAAARMQHPDAFNAWRVATNLAPDDPEVAAGMASICADRGEPRLGVIALERVRAYQDELGAAFNLALGWALLAAGRAADAEVEAKLAAALAPGEPEVVELLAALVARKKSKVRG